MVGQVDVTERFLLLHELSSGARETGSGTTFRALDRETREEVHLTLLVGDEHQHQRFLAECDVARKLTSPLLSRLGAVGASGNMVFVATSRAAAVDLSCVVAGGSLPLVPAARILWSLCVALSGLHGRGLVHGDVRSRHVRFTPAGEVFLTGYVPSPFGASLKNFGDEDVVPRYTPPEWTTAKVCHPTGDLYSLGLLAFEVLAGRPLLTPASLQETLQQQAGIQRQLDQNQPLDPAIPGALAPVLAALLQYDPNRRPQNAVDLMPTLQAALAGTGHQLPLTDVMQARLTYPVVAERKRLLEEARAFLEAGNHLGASASLRNHAELAPGVSAGEVDRISELLMDCLWLTFSTDPSEEVARNRSEAVCLRVLCAAEILGVASLAGAARSRLKTFRPAEAREVDEEAEAAALAALTSRLHAVPGDGAALLGLACRQVGLTRSPEQTLEGFSAELAQWQELHQVALIQKARELGGGTERAGLLQEIRSLAGEALETSRSEAPSASAEAAAPPPGAPAPDASGERASVPPLAPAEALDVEALFSQVAEHLAAGRLPTAAADVLDELFVADVLTLPEHHATVVAWVHEFLWQAMRPGPPDPARDSATEILMKVARAVDLETVLPICERVLLQNLPDGQEADRLQYLLDVAPDSIPILQEASRLATARGSDETWILYLSHAAERFLEVGELALATRMYTSIRTTDATHPDAARGLERVDELRRKEDVARKQFVAVERTMENATMSATALIACKGFMALNPHYVPALQATAKLHLMEENHTQAARIHLDLAKRALYRESHEEARKLFRSVLQNDFENEEALLYLACLEPPAIDSPRETWRLRISILERERLWDAAIFQARKQLGGTQEDFPILASMAQLCRRAGKDPSPHLIAQGFLAREAGDKRLARECLEAGIEEAEDRNAVINDLLRQVGIHAIIPATELVGMKH